LRSSIDLTIADEFEAHCSSTSCLVADEPFERSKALRSTSLAPKRRAISAASLTASSADADPAVPTATVEITEGAYRDPRDQEVLHKDHHLSRPDRLRLST
jgi:hypothetical protein